MSMFDTNIDDQQAGLFGAPPAAPSNQQASSLPVGLDFTQLDPQTRLSVLERNRDQYMDQMGEKLYRDRVSAAEKELSDFSGEDINMNILGSLQDLGATVSAGEGDVAPGVERFRSGFFDETFLGSGPEDDGILGVRNLFRSAVLTRDTKEKATALNLIANNFDLDARDKLEGQGQVSNYEAKVAGAAQSDIRSREATPAQIERAVLELRDVTNAIDFRNNNNVRFDKAGREWRVDTNPETGEYDFQRVVTYKDENGIMQQAELDDPTRNVISAVVDLSDEEFRAQYYNSAPEGTMIIRNGDIYVKGSDQDPLASQQ